MRIICPNCDAQYEVPDEVIPPEGRDVQCSNCSTTWTFEHPDRPDDDAQATAPRPVSGSGGVAPGDDPEDAEDQAPHPAPPRRELDPRVADILREEARRETTARAADTKAEGLEVQTDLGLTESEAPSARPRRADVDSRAHDTDSPEGGHGPTPVDSAGAASAGEATRSSPAPDPQPAAEATAVAPASGRDLLPDVEEINSTLRSTGDRDAAGDDLDPETAEETRQRRGFRRGFLAAVLIFVIALLIYQFAPEIAEAMPDADPWISAYVTWVDNIRVALDQRVQDVLGWLDRLSTPEI